MMMCQIAQGLPEYHCVFTPFYADGLPGLLARLGLLNFTILGRPHQRNCERFLRDQGLLVDFGGECGDYDLVVTGTDLIVQSNIRGLPLVLVQEGMTEPEGLLYYWVRDLKLPRYLANTAATGLSNAYDAFCVASPGYRDLFLRKGARPEKLFVTGIPNFDNVREYIDNDFPHRGYVLAATSSSRETGKFHNRAAFIKKALRIANGRPLFFKLHPNEHIQRACKEIERFAPAAKIFSAGNVHHMIANCDALIAENSTVIYTALGLGKEVHADVDVDTLRSLTPIQNGGASAARIADVCYYLLTTPLAERQRTLGRIRLRLNRLAANF